eukprot:scaffold3023_cov175-Amphora_coffeaeformis.AAC.16
MPPPTPGKKPPLTPQQKEKRRLSQRARRAKETLEQRLARIDKEKQRVSKIRKKAKIEKCLLAKQLFINNIAMSATNDKDVEVQRLKALQQFAVAQSDTSKAMERSAVALENIAKANADERKQNTPLIVDRIGYATNSIPANSNGIPGFVPAVSSTGSTISNSTASNSNGMTPPGCVPGFAAATNSNGFAPSGGVPGFTAASNSNGFAPSGGVPGFAAATNSTNVDAAAVNAMDSCQTIDEIKKKFKPLYMEHILKPGRKIFVRVNHPNGVGGCLVERTVKGCSGSNITMVEGGEFFDMSRIVIDYARDDVTFPFQYKE